MRLILELLCMMSLCHLNATDEIFGVKFVITQTVPKDKYDYKKLQVSLNAYIDYIYINKLENNNQKLKLNNSVLTYTPQTDILANIRSDLQRNHLSPSIKDILLDHLRNALVYMAKEFSDQVIQFFKKHLTVEYTPDCRSVVYIVKPADIVFNYNEYNTNIASAYDKYIKDDSINVDRIINITKEQAKYYTLEIIKYFQNYDQYHMTVSEKSPIIQNTIERVKLDALTKANNHTQDPNKFIKLIEFFTGRIWQTRYVIMPIIDNHKPIANIYTRKEGTVGSTTTVIIYRNHVADNKIELYIPMTEKAINEITKAEHDPVKQFAAFHRYVILNNGHTTGNVFVQENLARIISASIENSSNNRSKLKSIEIPIGFGSQPIKDYITVTVNLTTDDYLQ